MAATQDTSAVNKAAKGGDHDRVAMLSLRADGSPDQHDPEFIGDKDATLAATEEQFRQQAVSAADAEVRRVAVDAEVSTTEDPEVAKIQKAHEAAAKGAESAAKSAVDSLSK